MFKNQRLPMASLVAAACFVALIATMGASARYFLDLPSLLVVIIFPLLFQLALYGASGFGRAFAAPFDEEASVSELRRAVNFFRTYGRATWLFAVFASISSVIAALGDIADLSRIGPYVAITLLCLLYAAAIDLIVLCPCAARARLRADRGEPSQAAMGRPASSAVGQD